MRGVRVPLKHLFFHLLNLGPPGEGRNLSAPMCLNASHPPVETRSQGSLPAQSLECGCRSPGGWDTHGWLRQQLPGPVELGQEAAPKPRKGPRRVASWPCERPPLHLSGTPWMAGGRRAGPGPGRGAAQPCVPKGSLIGLQNLRGWVWGGTSLPRTPQLERT